MKIIPRSPQQYVNIKDPLLGEIEIYKEGKSFLYQQGVYLLAYHEDKLTYEFEGNECAGPPALVPPKSPSDVVIPDAMKVSVKGPKAPVPASPDTPDGPKTEDAS
jgi:hypothetical protein